MKSHSLPSSIRSLVTELHFVQIRWQNVRLLIPKFALYATISAPLMDRFFYHKGRRLGLLSLGGYEIPILYPLPTGTWFQPRYVVVISHTRDNCFGLYGYPADELKYNLHLDVEHQSVKGIVTPYL